MYYDKCLSNNNGLDRSQCSPDCGETAYLSAYSLATQPIRCADIPQKINIGNVCLQKNIQLRDCGTVIPKEDGIYYVKLSAQLRKRNVCNCCPKEPTFVRIYATVNGENAISVCKCINLDNNVTTPIELSGLLDLKRNDIVKFMIVSNDDMVEMKRYCGCGCEPVMPSVSLNMFKNSYS